jgi:hypothetical protein
MEENTQLTLEEIVLNAFGKLILIEGEKAASKPSRDKWSAKQIIGHLIDSASNNHGRFMRAQFSDDLIFQGYQQEGWVENQNYQEAEWHDLLILWRQFNMHIAFLIKQIPIGILTQERKQHNLNKIAWKTVPIDQPVTLAYFIDDYVAHLQHHLKQVFDLIEA